MRRPEDLRTTGVGFYLELKQGLVKVKETSGTFKCEMCMMFKENCTAPIGKKHAICFATERPDKKSVYFVKTKTK